MPVNPERKRTLERLRKIQADASNIRAKKAGTSFVWKGAKGTDFARARIERLGKVAMEKGPNQEIARKLFELFRAGERGDISPESTGPASDHQVLATLVNKINSTERNMPIQMTKLEQRVFERYKDLI